MYLYEIKLNGVVIV